MTSDRRHRCTRCDELLTRRVIWLDLNLRTLEYSSVDWPEEDSQGAFPFGADCARRVDVARQPRRASREEQHGGAPRTYGGY